MRFPGASHLLCISASLRQNGEPVHCSASPQPSSLKHVANGSPGRRLYCFISVPSSHRDEVGRKIQSSQTMQIPVLNLLSCEGGWVKRYTLFFPPEPKQLEFQGWGVGWGTQP